MVYLHIFLGVNGRLVRKGLCTSFSPLPRRVFAKTGGFVPPDGPLTRLLSVILTVLNIQRREETGSVDLNCQISALAAARLRVG